MGKSDPIVFRLYHDCLKSIHENLIFKNVSILGAVDDNAFTDLINCENKKFYDFQMGNWNINDSSWNIDSDQDLIICTRCPYFSKDPISFFSNIHKNLSPGGKFLVDWGVGDHWRFDNYKVGWVKEDEHESFYADDNFLWSMCWHESFLENLQYQRFESFVEKFGYNDVRKAIFEEVPSVFNLEEISEMFHFGYHILTLWEDSPQMSVVIAGIKK